MKQNGSLRFFFIVQVIHVYYIKFVMLLNILFMHMYGFSKIE